MKRALLLIAACAAIYTVAAWWAAARLPETGVAMHVNGAGEVDRYGTRASAINFFIGLGALVVVLAIGSVCLSRFGPLKRLNIPHKEYWTQPQRGPVVRQMIMWDMAVIFGITLLGLSSVPINIALMSSNPAGVSMLTLLVPIGAMLIAMVGYLIWMVTRRYRPKAP